MLHEFGNVILQAGEVIRNMASTKRYVERCWSRVSHTIGTGTDNKVLHTVNERETLVRMVIDLDVFSYSAGSAGAYGFTIGREPQGVAVVAPGFGEDLDNDAVKEMIFQKVGSFPNVDLHDSIEVDLKSMRKLDPGDEIVLRSSAAQASSVGLSGTVTMFFKQT